MDWRIEKERELLEEIKEIGFTIKEIEKSINFNNEVVEKSNKLLNDYMKKEGHNNAEIGKYQGITTILEMVLYQSEIKDINIIKHINNKLLNYTYIYNDKERLKSYRNILNNKQDQLNQLKKYGRIIAS